MTPISLTSSVLSNPKLTPLDRAKQLTATLLSERSEASGALLARQLHEALRALDRAAPVKLDRGPAPLRQAGSGLYNRVRIVNVGVVLA